MEKPFDESWFHAPLRAVGDRAMLDAAETHHLQKVLRIHPGRGIRVSNGEGTVFACETRRSDPGLEIEAAGILLGVPEPPRLHMVLGLLKGRDIEEPVEGLCQLPIAAIHLVTTDNTQEFKGQDHVRQMERLRSKSLVALKQAKKAWLTAIHEPLPLRQWRENHPEPIVLVHPGLERLDRIGSGRFYVLIGPEGGFSKSEINWLSSQENSNILGLGESRIRSIHAPLIACGKLMGLSHF